MNSNEESIKKYNDLMIKYLNDLVNSIENNELNSMIFADIANHLKEQLNALSLDISDQGVRTLMANAFKEYSNILKKYFDSSNIHRIDVKNDGNNTSVNEMNEVTSNLASAVTNMNKITEYMDLINRIKSTLKGYFSQNYSNYQSVEFEIEQILNDVIVGAFTTYTTKKIEDFTKDILPELYTIADSIIYDANKTETNVLQSNNGNAERDAFINETMDIEIEEGFENGLVTLKIVDSNGNVSMYYGTEAMEKLTSYNQLYESSRPGKKADTSNWAFDTSDKLKNENNNVQISITKSNENGEFNTNNNSSNDEDNITNHPDSDTQNKINSSEELIKKYLSGYEEGNNNNQTQEQVAINNDEWGNLTSTINNDDFNNLTMPTNDGNIQSNSEIINSLNSPSDIMNYFNDREKENDNQTSLTNLDNSNINNGEASANNNEDYNNLISTINSQDNQSTTNNNQNAISDNFVSENTIDSDMQKIKNSIGVEDHEYSGSFSFLPEYDNPNVERDEFIKRATGIEIEEDTDHKGILYLKVTEPTGREQIYTGKEAVRMIKNFNQTYLDANPYARVDTTLIDNFKEE